MREHPSAPPDCKALKAGEGAKLLEKINKAEEAEYRLYGEQEDRMEKIGKNVNRTSVRGLRSLGSVITVRL